MKKILILVIVILAVNAGCYQSKADYPYYFDLENLKAESHLIIVGEIINVEKGKDINIGQKNSIKRKYSVSEVKVTEVIKGDVKVGDTIKVKQLENEETNKEAGYFKKKEEYMLFLETYDADVPYSLLNPFQGKILIENSKIKVDEKNKMEDLKDITDVNKVKEKLKN